jgi:hypothetical protein
LGTAQALTPPNLATTESVFTLMVTGTVTVKVTVAVAVTVTVATVNLN